MKLHPLPPDAKCPYCCKGGLAFVRHKSQGDLYRCTAATPCKGHSLHHRGNGGACGVSAESAILGLLSWTECPGEEPPRKEEVTEEYLTTRRAASGHHRLGQLWEGTIARGAKAKSAREWPCCTQSSPPSNRKHTKP